MKLSLNVIAGERSFARAMRRVRGRLQVLIDEFAQVEMTSPIHEALLVSVTDTEPLGFFEEVPNEDGVFQVSVGCDSHVGDDELVLQVLDALRKAVIVCPFSRPDREAFQGFLERHERKLFGSK